MESAEAVQSDPTDPSFSRLGVLDPVVVGAAPTKAYIVTLEDGRTSALLDIGASTVIVSGPFDKSNYAPVLARLEAR